MTTLSEDGVETICGHFCRNLSREKLTKQPSSLGDVCDGNHASDAFLLKSHNSCRQLAYRCPTKTVVCCTWILLCQLLRVFQPQHFTRFRAKDSILTNEDLLRSV